VDGGVGWDGSFGCAFALRERMEMDEEKLEEGLGGRGVGYVERMGHCVWFRGWFDI
jgi:hypothetical protein